MNETDTPIARERIQALKDLDILDTPPEDQFDRITRMAARIFEVPIAQINFIDGDRQWSKSSFGVDRGEMSTSRSFCRRTLENDTVTVVQDPEETGFEDHPYVLGEPHVNFYAGAPLRNPEGVPLGTLCVMDTNERVWRESEGETLRELADLVEDELKLHQAGQTIQRSERHYRRLFEESRDAILVTTPEGAFLDANPATEELFGYSREELLRLNVQELYADVDRRADYRRAMDEEGSVRDFEVTLRKKDGTRLECLVTATTRFDEQGHVVAYQDIIRDVTERKRKEEQIRILNQILRHDVRNDANVILAWASMLQQKTDDEYSDFISYIQMASRRVVEVTNAARDLMETLGGEELPELEPIALLPVLESEVNKVQTSHQEAEITLDASIPPDLAVEANQMLASVFGNLLSNAIRHNDKDEPRVAARVRRTNGEVDIQVADNGPGIPDEEKEAVFGEGHHGPNPNSTGIGLYLVRTLLDQFGGDVRVEDNEPEGTIFRVRLPIAAEGVGADELESDEADAEST